MPFLFLLAFPVAEFIFTGWLITRVGWGMVGLWSLLALAIGLLMLRHHQIAVAMTMVSDLRQGRVTAGTVFRVIRYYIAAVLFMLPGVLGDVIAVLLLLWPVRTAASPQQAPADSGVIEGEYREVTPADDQQKQIRQQRDE